uniref:Uncharacterized protein n=1 Tax=Knipowitschia caucasica TaxID=637954 RepID=A0AAV2M9H2_KNICA
MDRWTLRPRHRQLHTLHSRSLTQHCDRRLHPEHCEENHGGTMETGHYWSQRDVPNWSYPETTATSQFPFTLDHGAHGAFPLEPQERGAQAGVWSSHSELYRRDRTKRSDSFRELEAWALRYSHSLPRRRRMEAELRGGLREPTDSREKQDGNMHQFTSGGSASRQALDHSPPGQNMDTISYKTKFYHHPPHYSAPPPYRVQSPNVLQQRYGKESYLEPSEWNEEEDVREAHGQSPDTKLELLQPPTRDPDFTLLDCPSVENLASKDVWDQSASVCPRENQDEGNCPRSLWDAVSRIRKHTAPDSENDEEEELTDSWDKDSLLNRFENITTSSDFSASEECEDSMDRSDSRCSGKSQESDGTIVDEDLDSREMWTEDLDSREMWTEDLESREMWTEELESREMWTEDLESREMWTEELESREMWTEDLESREMWTEELESREMWTEDQETAAERDETEEGSNLGGTGSRRSVMNVNNQ